MVVYTIAIIGTTQTGPAIRCRNAEKSEEFTPQSLHLLAQRLKPFLQLDMDAVNLIRLQAA